MITVLAIDRGDVADYVETLVVVMVVLIFIRIIMSFIPRMPYNRWLDAFLSFVTQVTDPILNPLRAGAANGEDRSGRHRPLTDRSRPCSSSSWEESSRA